MNAKQIKLSNAEVSAHYFDGPSQVEIDGHTFEITYHIVNRKCYDFEPTPTVQYKMDGKRIARAKAYAALQ